MNLMVRAFLITIILFSTALWSNVQCNSITELNAEFSRLNKLADKVEANEHLHPLAEKYIGLGSIYNAGNVHVVLAKNYGVLKQGELQKEAIENALTLFSRLEDKSGLVSAYANFSRMYKNEGEKEKSLKYAYKIFDHATESADKVQTAKALSRIGKVHEYFGNFQQALDYYQRRTLVLKDSELFEMIAIGNSQIGEMYLNLEQFELGSEFIHKAKSYYSENGLLKRLFVSYLNLGVGKAGLEQMDSAKYYYLKVINAPIDESSTFVRATARKNLGIIYLAEEKCELAISHFEQVDDYYMNNQEQKGFSYYLMQRVEGELCIGDTINAFLFLQKLKSLNDTLYSDYQEVIFSENQLKEEIQTLQEEAQQAKYNFSMRLLGSGVVGLCALGFFGYRNIRLRNKAKEAEFKRTQERQLEAVEKLEREVEIKSVNAMLDGEEKERKRIATELHDNLGALLSAVKMNYSVLKTKSQALGVDDKIEQVGELIDDACDENRRISHNIISPTLMKFGVLAATEEFSQKFSNSELTIDVETNDLDIRLSEGRELALFRVIQEVINNTIKHAEASECFINFEEDNAQLMIQVSDDGIGFDPEKIDEKAGLGLANMRSRIRHMGGKLTIHSKPNSGAEIRMEIPL